MAQCSGRQLLLWPLPHSLKRCPVRVAWQQGLCRWRRERATAPTGPSHVAPLTISRNQQLRESIGRAQLAFLAIFLEKLLVPFLHPALPRKNENRLTRKQHAWSHPNRIASTSGSQKTEVLCTFDCVTYRPTTKHSLRQKGPLHPDGLGLILSTHFTHTSKMQRW